MPVVAYVEAVVFFAAFGLASASHLRSVRAQLIRAGTLLMAVALTAVFADRATADEMVKLLPGTANEINAYVAGPEDAKERVLIVHDWFGLTSSTMAEAVWFGQHGIRAVAIDLYDGQVAETHGEAEKLMKGLDPAAATRTIRNALEAIGAAERPVVIIGYSISGKIALDAQLADQQMISGAALVYGSGYETIPDAALKSLTRPLLVVTGSKDNRSVSAQEALRDRMSAFGYLIEAYVYPGVDHAYAQSLFNGGKNFDLKATMATREVIEDFVKQATDGARGEALADAERPASLPQDLPSQEVTGSHGSGPPFAVRLLLKRTSGGNEKPCTGVVLSKHWVMTAGHCVRAAPVQDDNKDRVKVRAGANATSDSANVFVGGGSYYIHPEYSGSNRDLGDDFALILLYDGGLSSFTPAKIMGESSAGYLTSEIGRGIGHAWIAGYGQGSGPGGAKSCSTGTGGVSRTGNFKILPNWPNGAGQIPTRWSPGSPFINEIRLKFGHHTPCDGDSGGPIYFQYDGQDVVAGLHAGTVNDFLTELHKGPSIRRRLDWIIDMSKEKGVPLKCTPSFSNVGPDWWSCTESNVANLDVRNTYSGAECVSSIAEKAKNLHYGGGVFVPTGDATQVICPIVKAIFDSRGRLTVAVAATGGTKCRLVSHGVFTFDSESSEEKTFPGAGISGLEFEIPSSLRGATELSCTLQTGDRILNYLARED
jgi:dienelactone hydrolase